MPDLSSNDQKMLLACARKSMETFIRSGDHYAFETDEPGLLLKRGCFVTLRKGGKLRGCVGTFDASLPVYQNVLRMAVAAATQDSRFPTVNKSELDSIKIEVSVLGLHEKIQSIDEIEIGKHGILVQHGGRSGTFLPEVAVEQNWGIAEFVTYCAREKAGLSPEECSQAEVYRYEVEKCKEE